MSPFEDRRNRCELFAVGRLFETESVRHDQAPWLDAQDDAGRVVLPTPEIEAADGQ